MQIVKQYPAGVFCWIDLATSNMGAAKLFYGGLFGWEIEDLPMGEGMCYAMCRYQDQDVCAMYSMSEAMINQRIPPHWTSYISVADVDAVVSKAKLLGAKVTLPAFNVLDSGRMAKIEDPMGASVSLWQPRTHAGARLVNQPNTWCWNELVVDDTQAALGFYGALFGWTGEAFDDHNGNSYVTVRNHDRLVGGMRTISPEWGNVPPWWGVYFAVADCTQAITQATALGAAVVLPATPIPEIGTLAVLADPSCVQFTVIALDSADPPPGYGDDRGYGGDNDSHRTPSAC